MRASFLLLLRACCSCCVALPGLPWLTGCSPERGANSKRISLDADVAITNQFRRCLKAVLLFSAWLQGRTPRGNSSPKESVSCASVPCCSCCSGVVTSCSCYGSLLVIVVVPEIKQMPCQFFKSLVNQWLEDSVGREGEKKAGFSLPLNPASVTKY